jgi:hypothetical protein
MGDCNSEGNALTNNTGVFAMLDNKCNGWQVLGSKHLRGIAKRI